MIRKRQELVEWAREEGLRKETGGSQAIHPAMGSVLWSPGQKNQCSRQQSRLQAQEVILCHLLWPPESPSSARKSYKAFELPRSWDPGWPRAGAANIWAAGGHVRGFLSFLQDQHVPGCPAARTAARPLRRRWADTKPKDPRRLQRKPPAEGGKCHWGAQSVLL